MGRFDFFGRQLSLHLGAAFATDRTAHVGEHLVPMPHFGVVLARRDWDALAASLLAKQLAFVIGPTIRFAGEPGEQATNVLPGSLRQPDRE